MQSRLLLTSSVLMLAAALAATSIHHAAAQPKQGAGSPAPLSSEEAKLRKDWSLVMSQKAAPAKGCFTATYPQTDWQSAPCVKAPNIPMPPKVGPRSFVVGNGDDISAEAPSGHITQAIGRFESVTNVTSVSSPIGNAGAAVTNAYTLQINTNFMTSTACSGSPNPSCKGWEQFVYFTNGTSGSAFIQYWLIQYNAPCPSGQSWNQFSFTGSTDIYCYKNAANAASVPNQPITNMSNWTFSGNATTSADSVTFSTGSTVYTATGDNAVAAASGWTIAEFNIFGAGGNSSGGGEATFNAGASVHARTQIVYGGTAAPNCYASGFTGETNNLSFGPSAPAGTGPGPAVIFQESIAGGASSNCAAAVTVGDTHLRTFHGLFYDFQASGDFTVAVVDPDFEVQARQVSSAPTWPDASVNSAVAARFGNTQVAICLAPDTHEPTVFVDGKATPVADGDPLVLQGAGVLRRGNIYRVTGDEGDSIRVTVNSTWMDVDVGLGRWPSTVRGLIANANDNIDQIATRDGQVLTNPFSFDELYGRFADSWRVSEKDSMLTVCDGSQKVKAGRPAKPFFVEDLEPAQRDGARAICLAAGVKQGALLDACTLDVVVLGDPTAANVFVDAIMPGAVGSITRPGSGKPPGDGGTTSGGPSSGGPAGGVLVECRWLLVLLAIAIAIIIWLLMRKK